MRVVHVLNSERNMLGVERHVLNLAGAQMAQGFSVLIVTDLPGKFEQACCERNIPLTVVRELERGDSARPIMKTVQSLIAQFKSFNAELIHCHTLPVSGQAIPAGNQIKVPCVFTFHSIPAAHGPVGIMNVARNMGLSFTTISVSKAGFDALKKSGMSGTEVYYVPNGTTAAAASPAGAAQKRESSRPDLILVGSLGISKGIDVAILVMAELRRRRGRDCPVLSIYGEGSYAEYFKEMTSVLGLTDIVRFCGIQPGILDRCASRDILVMPSRAETGPLVVLEAMSRGMPIATTDVGETSAMLPDSRYGRIVPVNSIAALADAIESLLSDVADGRFDPGLLIERHRSTYTSEKMAERTEAVYRQVLLHASAPLVTDGAGPRQ